MASGNYNTTMCKPVRVRMPVVKNKGTDAKGKGERFALTESEIDHLVYQLYDQTEKEIKIVESCE